uniref:PHD-type domain-containing protein n=1 Tax=Ananas comosus var. bracteatus TaxID=296719 RepID=A0A6V7NI99_ANACO|nr:unnamed protein product [Ananas comosus var. bracteatus]
MAKPRPRSEFSIPTPSKDPTKLSSLGTVCLCVPRTRRSHRMSRGWRASRRGARIECEGEGAVSADTIEGKCFVHSFKKYTKLDAVGNEDFFCRFEYKSATGSFVPDRIAVFCKCEMPYNPDDLMIQCEECSDWYHPSCVGMKIEEAKKLEHFFCESCSPENGKKSEKSHSATRQTEQKVDSKRRRR